MMELDGWAAMAVIIKIVVYASTLVAAGTGLFRTLFATETNALRRVVPRTLVISTVCAAAATLFQMATQAGMLADAGPAGMFDGEMHDLIWQTAAGDACFTRLSGLALLLLSLVLPGHVASAAGVLGAAAVCVSFGLSGHTSEDSPYPLRALLVVHLMGISFWVGALLPLKSAAAGHLPLADAAALAEKFGRLAAWMVGALVLAGLLIGWAILGSPLALVTSSYGQVLAVKLVLVAALLGLAALNKLRLAPSMRLGDGGAANGLVRSINAEVAFFLTILGATSVLTTVMNLP